MRVVYRGRTPRARSSLSFAVSGWLHGCVLAWVILGGPGKTLQRAQSIYDREIRPNEKRIVWYSLREKLPEVAPADAQPDALPARARLKAPQTMVAGARDDARPAPLIWAPEPDLSPAKTAPLPNVVAMAAPKVVRPFVTPPVKSLPLPSALPLSEAPGVALADVRTVFPLPSAAPGGPSRAFTPPPKVRMQRQAMLQLPEGPAPEMLVEPNALPFPDAGPRPQPRTFVAPPVKRRAVAVAALPAAPEVAGVGAQQRFGPQGDTLVAALIGTPEAPRAVAVSPGIPGGMAEASLAIVGLNPSRTTEVPAPPGSRPAGFSAGPQPREEGGPGANRGALVNVPGLVVEGGARETRATLMANLSPTSRENLLAARNLMAAAPKVPVEPHAPRAVPRDPRFAGRVVYTIAIQMPNVTSFSGSWLVWFAEREPLPAASPEQMRPPEVVRKVDPKYIAAAAAERVEGTVRLFGVIRKDGQVGGIAVLRQLDERLDRSAQEALAKWEFVPAKRGGVPVDVDAIFEIPFHLAPRTNQ